MLVWTLLLGIPSVIFHDQNFMGLSQAFFLLSSIYHIGIFYFNAYFLYPRLLRRRRWPLYLIALVAVIQLSYRVKIYLLELQPDFHLNDNNRKVIFFGLFPFLLASIIFRLVSDRIWFERKEKEARAERLAAELKFLRSQVSPHFLFNMMTNLVSLARQKSDLLEPSLIKLSDLLRYMLYDSAEDKIDMEREIENLEDYVALQQLRFGDEVSVELEIENECRGCRIEPMLLVPFIENAFKHGVGMVNDPYIKITLSVRGRVVAFSVRNRFNSADISKDRSSGIGLVNVRNRLSLLYDRKYELLISGEDSVFSVQLTLDLS